MMSMNESMYSSQSMYPYMIGPQVYGQKITPYSPMMLAGLPYDYSYNAPQTSVFQYRNVPIAPCLEKKDSLSSTRPQSAKRRQKQKTSRAHTKRTPAYWQMITQSCSLNEDEKLLVRLKGIDELPWKEIQDRFNRDRGKVMKQPALQMRMRRLTERINKMNEDQFRKPPPREEPHQDPLNNFSALQAPVANTSFYPSAGQVMAQTLPDPLTWPGGLYYDHISLSPVA